MNRIMEPGDKINTFARFESLQIGEWFENGNGTFEVVDTVKNSTINAAEVIIDDTGAKIGLINGNQNTTYTDVRNSIYLG